MGNLGLTQSSHLVTGRTCIQICWKRLEISCSIALQWNGIERHNHFNYKEQIFDEAGNETGERNGAKEVEGDDAKTARNRAAAQAVAHVVISPKFKGMFGKEDTAHKKGYYGPFSFFNSQSKFHQTFGYKPIILPSNPMGGSNNGVKEKL